MASVQVSLARLPATAGELFGREGDLGWLDAAWREGAHVATVVAWGGVGKTSLVNTWLAGVRDRGWEGAERVYGWSFYSQGTDRLSSSDEFVDAALRWFGDPDPKVGSAFERGERLAGLVREHKTILVLDGVEPLQWGPGVQEGRLKDPALQALLKELAAQNSGLCVVTSRIGLADLDGLSGDKVRALDLRNLSPEAGAALLKKKGAKGTDGEMQEASGEYKGHSLALTLLGSYLTEVAEGDIRRRREIGPIEAEETQGGHARRVMKSYEPLLGKPEAAILHMLGLFDRPAEEGELAALRADPIIPGLTDGLAGIRGREWNKAVARLRKIGLLLTEQDKRLDAHPLVREHFGEQLKREQPEAWREGHRRLYEYLKEKAKPLPENVEEMAPLYAAVVHGCLAGKNQEALAEVFRDRIKRGDEFFNSRKLGAFGSEVAVLSAFFDPPWERLAPGLSEADQAWVLNAAGFALRALGRLSEAAGLMRLSVEMGIAQQNWEAAARRASNLSDLLLTHGELSEAEAQARRSVDLADRSGDAFQRMARRTTLAAAQHARGLGAEAAALFEEAERMQEELQPAYPRLFSFWGFQYCDLLLDQGRDVEVRERAAQTLEWVLKLDKDVLSAALDHLSLGRAHLLGVQRGTGGDLAKATSHLQQAVDGLRRAGQDDYAPLGLLARAALHLHNRDFAGARRDLDETLSLATRCEFRLHEADAHLGFTRLALAERDPERAQTHLEAARDIIAKTGYHRREGELEALLSACREEEKERRGAEAQRRKKAEKQTTSRDGGASGQGQGKSLAPLRPRASAFFSSPPSDPSDPTATPHDTSTPMTTSTRPPVDFLIFAPLSEERTAVLSKLPGHHKLDSEGDDVHVYYEALLPTRRRDKAVYRLIVTSPKDMGPVHAAVTAMAAANRWRPAHVLVVGIAGGVEAEVDLGDITVAKSVADYTLGKVNEDGTREERWDMYPADPTLLHAANNFITGFTDLLSTPRPKGKADPRWHTGVIASGGDVITSKDLIALYRKDMPKLIGVEMEGSGVAAALASHPLRPKLLMIRGVSDLADAQGNAATKQTWRAYARDVAAAYAIALLREGPVPAAVNPP